MKYFTEAQARILAEFDKDYRARKLNNHQWIVWCDNSDHIVEFDQRTIDQLTKSGI